MFFGKLGCNWPSVSENEVINVFSLLVCSYYLLMTNDMTLYLTNLNHLTKKCFMSSMAGLDSVILKKLICEKVWMDTWTDRQIDNKQQVFFCNAQYIKIKY